MRASTIEEKLRVSALCLSPPLVVCPKCLGAFDIGGPSPLYAARQADDRPFGVSAEVQAVSGTPIDAELLDAPADALEARKIAKAYSFDRDGDFRRRPSVERVESIHES